MDYLKVFVDFLEDIDPLTDDEVGRLFRAMLIYAKDGTTPNLDGNERFLWTTARKNIDRTGLFLEKQRANGSKGGKPKRTQDNPDKPKLTQTNPTKATESPKEKEKDKDKEKDNSLIRHRYGEYKNVLLTDEDVAKLREEFTDWQERIEKLSEYLAKTGRSYKSHLAVIRSWARSDKKPAEDQTAWMRSYIGGAG